MTGKKAEVQTNRLCYLPKVALMVEWQSWDLSPLQSDSDNKILNHPPACDSDTGSLSKVMKERFVNICTRQKTISSGKVYTDIFLSKRNKEMYRKLKYSK